MPIKNACFSQKKLYKPDNEKMKRVVNIEKPFHKLVYFFSLAAFAVVEHKKRDGKENAKLNKTVKNVYRKNVHYNI